jgi:NADH-quinone oxidoreductase subunit M
MNAVVVALIVIPLLSAIVAASLGHARAPAVRWTALGSTVLSLVLSIGLASELAGKRYEKSPNLKSFAPEYETNLVVLPLEQKSAAGDDVAPAAIRFHVGVDGISIWLVALTSLLMFCAVLGSWTAITERVNEYYAWMLALQMAMVGVFLSVDVILFYVFFELTLIPLFFLIGIWGGPQRQYAARKFFVYTLGGSLITLLGVIGSILLLQSYTGELTFSIPRLAELSRQVAQDPTKAEAWIAAQGWLFAAMMVGFAIKVPLFPVHTWLPLAHVEAPTAGSVLLAGVLLKLGTYGFLRICVPIAPEASVTFGAPFITTLGIIGIVYGSFCALMQDDIKKMVAYSSVAHLGLCMVGLFALNEVGMMGSLLVMVNHGLSTGALFLLVGMLYERYHTRKIADYSGMAARLKLLAFFMVFISMSSIGLPGLNGFIGEITSLMGIFSERLPSINGMLIAALATSGVVLGAWYTLSLLRDVFFGPLKEPKHEGHKVEDLNGREIVTLLPIAALCLVIGLYSPAFTKVAEPEIKYVAGVTRKAADDIKKREVAQKAKEE